MAFNHEIHKFLKCIIMVFEYQRTVYLVVIIVKVVNDGYILQKQSPVHHHLL